MWISFLSFSIIVYLHSCEAEANSVPIDDEDVRHVDWTLHKIARNLGQSLDETVAVHTIVDKISQLISNRHNSSELTEYVPSRRPVEVSRTRPSSKAKLDSILDKRNRLKSVAGRFADSDFEDEEVENSRVAEADFFEGDIVLWKSQAEHLYADAMHSKDTRKKRKFIAPLVRRWDSSQPIQYSFDGSHSAREQKIIQLALEHWQNITCLDFEKMESKPKGNRIVFTDVDGCASNVGRHPLGEPQFVSIAPECLRLGVIAHEVAHALGFWHEQSRPDRDVFVDVQWDNVDRGSKGQFLKEQPDDVDSGNVPYDFGSIMHYRSKAFARYDDLYTIYTNIGDYQRTIGQRDQLSFNDIRLMNNIYCSKKCKKRLPCLRGGYTDPRRCHRCRCPDGFTGKYCEQVMPGYGAECGGAIEVGESWVTLRSPNYPAEFKEGQECSWLLQAPTSMHIQLQFFGTFDMYCKAKHSLCMDYVEVRNNTDFANTGMRYCCYGTPREDVFSATRDLLVLFRSFYRQGKGFQARARAVVANGEWSSWDSWTECTGSCGACGTRTRKRTCPRGRVCPGSDRETKSCNINACELCPESKYVNAPCGGFLGLFRGVRCKVEKTVYVSCRNRCCHGFEEKKGECLPVF